MTLANNFVTTMLPITDADRARSFYGTALELPYRGTKAEGSLIFELAGGATLGLLVKPAGAQAQHTAMSFEVEDLRAAIAELESRGVTFEDYDLPGLKTVDPCLRARLRTGGVVPRPRRQHPLPAPEPLTRAAARRSARRELGHLAVADGDPANPVVRRLPAV